MSTPAPLTDSNPSGTVPVRRPPPLPESAQQSSDGELASGGSDSAWKRRLTLLTCATALSYYLSALFHLGAYILAAVVAALLGLVILPDEEWIDQPLRASLEDEEVADDAAKLQLTPEIDLGNDEQSSSMEQLARQLQIVDAGWIDSLQTDALTALSTGESEGDSASGSGFFFKMPEAGLAVTKGSFTAWTEPPSPAPGENYMIIIDVRLPDDIQRYRVADLVGEVKGTDNYRQRIPYDSRAKSAAAASTESGLKVIDSGSVLDVRDNKVQLVIRVPGAQRLVKDTITIRSRRLKENQELVLVFGRQPENN